ncbi:MAG: hypothetical protein AAGF92_14390 [Myxococcota bacterium]
MQLERAGDRALLLSMGSQQPYGYAVTARWLDGRGRWQDSDHIVGDLEDFPDLGVATDETGNAVVAWIEPGPFALYREHEIWARRYVAGEGWTEPEYVGDAGIAGQVGPKATFRSNGTPVVVWGRRYREGDEPSGYAISEHTDARGWGPPSVISASDNVHSRSLAGLGTDGEGGVLAIWSVYERDGSDIDRLATLRATQWSPETGWGDDSSLRDRRAWKWSHVIVDSEGTAWVFSRYATEGGCPTAVRYVAGQWEDAVDFAVGCEDGFEFGTLAVDNAGGAIAIWTERGEDDPAAFFSRYNPGDGWLSASPMPLGDGVLVPTYAVTARAGGDVLALWYRATSAEDGFRLSTWASQLRDDGLWTEPERLASRGPLFQIGIAPHLTSFEDGRAVGVWWRYDGVEVPYLRWEMTPWTSHYR